MSYTADAERYGDAEAFFRALRQAVPIAIRTIVRTAAPRQANCYYSSSDAAFADRYEALARYGEIKSGGVALEGGWRVYSSGAGIATRLIHQRLYFLDKKPQRLGLQAIAQVSLPLQDRDRAGPKRPMVEKNDCRIEGPIFPIGRTWHPRSQKTLWG